MSAELGRLAITLPAPGVPARECVELAVKAEREWGYDAIWMAETNGPDSPSLAGAIAWARIARLYYGAADPKSGGVAHGARVFDRPTCHHAPEVYDSIAAEESAALLKAFFRARR